MTDADDRLRRYVLAHFREDNPEHKAACPDVRVMDADARGGTYGCDTGCEYATFDATIECPHEAPEEYTFGQFGELYEIIGEMDGYG